MSGCETAIKTAFLNFCPDGQISRLHQIRDFIRPGSDHFKEDFIFTKMSARLFNELAEAEPVAVLGTLQYIFSKWDQQQFNNFKSGRQDIVFALEKIALYPKLFNGSARLLLKLAESDNSFHSNNALGTFVGLFSLAPGLVAPTGAVPLDRLELLKEIINSTSPTLFEIALKGFQKSLSHPIHSGPRIIGPEYQGLRETVALWTPKCEDEFHTAYKTYWKTLVDSRESLDMLKRKKINMVLVDSAEYLLYFEWMNEPIIKTLYSLLEDDTTDFKQLIDMISTTIKYRNNKLPSSTITHLKNIDELLTGKCLSQRVKRFAIYSNHNDFSSNDNYDDYSILRSIAEQCFELFDEFTDLIPDLIKGNNTALIQLGYEIGKLDGDRKAFRAIKQNYEIFSKDSTHMLIGGYLKSTFEFNIEEWEILILEIIKNSNYNKSIGSIIRESGITDNVIEALISSYDEKLIDITPILSLFHSCSVKKLKINNIIAIAQRLQDSNKYENAIDLLNFVFCDKKTTYTLPTLFAVDLFKKYSLSDKHSDIADYGCNQILEIVLKNNPEKHEDIFESFLNRIFCNTEFMSSHNPLYKIIKQIIKSDPNKCWKILSTKLETTSELQIWRFILWFNSSPIKLSDFSDDSVLNWIAEYPENRAELVSKMTLKTLDRSESGKLTRELLDRYGDQEKIQSAIMGNFFSGSWTGKESDYLQSKIEIANEWLNKETSKRIKCFIEKYIDVLSHQMERSLVHEEREF